MTQADRDLVAALRAELASIDPARACDRAAEAIGLGPDAAAREPSIARLAVRLGLGRVDGRRRTAASRWSDGSGRPFDWATAPDHCRAAYLRGRFLARGSLSLASARTHLEFVVEPAEAPRLAAWLNDWGLPSSWRLRRGRGVVTWKSADTVGTFLRRIGAASALLEIEARQVARAMRGDLNRVLNAEQANLQRAVAAAARQLAAIDRLDDDGRLGEQSHLVRSVAAARREAPEATFAELAERVGVHRSAVQRALDRIEWLALHDEDRPRRTADEDRTRRTGARGPDRAVAASRPAGLA